MAVDSREYRFTQHMRERFIQRSNKKFQHLQSCNCPDCKCCSKLIKEIHTELALNRKEIDREISRRINLSEENRSCTNNSEFMSWYYDKYGYDTRFEFLVHENIVFVVVYNNGKKIVVTCVSAKTHIAGKDHKSRVKFKKPKTDVFENFHLP